MGAHGVNHYLIVGQFPFCLPLRLPPQPAWYSGLFSLKPQGGGWVWMQSAQGGRGSPPQEITKEEPLSQDTGCLLRFLLKGQALSGVSVSCLASF